MRNTLVVADGGGSAAFIPYFELFGTFPASVLLTWALSRLMRTFSFRFTFFTTMGFFLAFFIVFAFWVYPSRDEICFLLEKKFGAIFGEAKFQVIFTHWPDMIFYVMAELWKVALLSVLFWGFLNQHLSMDKAKKFYPPLMLGTSIGTILAGPVTVFATSEWSWHLFHFSSARWQNSLCLLTFFLILFGLLTLLAFQALAKTMEKERMEEVPEKNEASFSRKLLSLTSSIKYLAGSSYLRALLFIVVAEYVSYTLGELIFLETLKEMYPTPSDYCQFMGQLTLWTGVLTAFSALVLTPYLLHNYRWSYSALATPILMVVTTAAFFVVICLGKAGLFFGIAFLPLAVILGSFHFCIGRSVKYTLFDAAKELAFIPLDQEGQVKGKLIIDGVGSRLGRGASSLISISLFLVTGGAAQSAPFAGLIAILFAVVSIPKMQHICREFEEKTVAKTLAQ